MKSPKKGTLTTTFQLLPLGLSVRGTHRKLEKELSLTKSKKMKAHDLIPHLEKLSPAPQNLNLVKQTIKRENDFWSRPDVQSADNGKLGSDKELKKLAIKHK